ncbi:MAG: hypothetical protein LUD53_02635, partial [Clostridiales bacterium]|nr:hypothetical protein [Clostridiales bacterium]
KLFNFFIVYLTGSTPKSSVSPKNLFLFLHGRPIIHFGKGGLYDFIRKASDDAQAVSAVR